MKRTTRIALLYWASVVLLPASWLLPAVSYADVCDQGIGVPTFLSSGTKPNLLMLLDNSGSMLDAAYSDTTSYCFDDTYDGAKVYGGYFAQDQWYKWSKGDFNPWKNGVEYTDGQRVYVNGIIWEVEEGGGGTSSGESLATDIGVSWKKVFSLNKWANNTNYPSDSFVWSGPQLYYSANGGTSNDPDISNGLNLADDTGVTDWVAVDSTWLNGRSYTVGDIVTYKGSLYKATTTNTSSGTGVYDDTGVSWQRLNEGSFVEADQTSACSGADYTHSDLCITLDTDAVPNQVPLFAARGNFLNWAMSSKFDVEKKILTGGKYNYYDDLMISENRGCSGSSTVKQIQMDGDGTNPGKFLSLGVRGARHQDDIYHEDRIDSSDDVARLEVLAITDGGYELSEKCQTAITCIVDSGLNGCQQKIKDCLETFPNSSSIMEDMRPALNNSLQACWQSEINDGIFSQLVTDCLTLYTGEKQPGSNFTPSRSYHPSELRPADGGPYLCYGIYDAGVDHLNRVGYMGRVWNAGGTGGTATCDPVQATDQCSSPYPCYWKYEGGVIVTDSDEENFKNESDGYVYKCTSVKNAGGCNNNGWEVYHIASDGTGECDPDSPMFGSSGDGDWEDPTWPDDKDVPAAPGNGILEAIKDYCDVMKVPEVIDPSDSAGKTGETGNAPALLRDSHLMAFLGGQDPLATMKGYIAEDTRPEGVMQSVAGDLRLGLMAFNSVGAATECNAEYLIDGVERFCPLENKDGATLLSELEDGDWVTEPNDPTYDSGRRRHVDDLAQDINDIRATSWTPLGEGLYSALGYYTQNSKLCLNVDANGNCLDEFLDVDNDPVQYWCQDNHILVITEGESTADVNSAVAGFAANPSDYFVTKTDDDDVAGDADGDPNLTADLNNDGTDESCEDSLYTSTYLDDMTWWGYHSRPLYKERYKYDPDGNPNEKNTIYTHLITTGTLTGSTAGECNPDTLMHNAAENGGTENYYSGEDPQELEDNLYAVLGDIMSRSSSGSAASVISSSRSGAGAVYQAVFWPNTQDEDDNRVSWVGDVHALFVGSEGKVYEDTNQDGKLFADEDIDGDGNLDVDEDANNNGVLDAGEDVDNDGKLDVDEDANKNGKLDEGDDRQVRFYFSNQVKRTRGCYEELDNSGQCPDDPVELCPSGTMCVEIQDIKYLWSANDRLRKMNVLKDRRIFTWSDLNNDGIVSDDGIVDTTGETFLLNSETDWDTLSKSVTGGRGSLREDFLTDLDVGDFAGMDSSKTDDPDKVDAQELDAMRALVEWLLGEDSLYNETSDELANGGNANGRLDRVLRSRQFKFVEKDADGNEIGAFTDVWRLGDVIHSSPMIVGKPAENYHYIYRDPSYQKFVERWTKRRNVVYFGGNDGMLHAVNSGFYFDDEAQFCCSVGMDPTKDDYNKCTATQLLDQNTQISYCEGSEYDLGEELWAYVPYNLQPHLKCLADRSYAHKYYVDQRPRIFDVQIFAEESECSDPNLSVYQDCIHAGGWGTILVGAMRFGGSSVDAQELNNYVDSEGAEDPRRFASSYFILDITNPEALPELLGEMTHVADGIPIGQNSSGENIYYADLHYTTSSPTMITMRDGGKDTAMSEWYLVMGNGPAEDDGSNYSGEKGKLAILPLEWLKGSVASNNWTDGVPTAVDSTSRKAFRIPDQQPEELGSWPQGGVFSVPFADNNSNSASYISDIIAVDYNIELEAPDNLGARYRTDAIYFGTTDGTTFGKYPGDYLPEYGDQFYWDGGGRVFRLVTKMTADNTLSGPEKASKPSEWSTPLGLNDAEDDDHEGAVRMLADVKMPVVAAPTIGYDGDNYWIYAGTGRFFDEKDKTDDGYCLDPSDTACDTRSPSAMFGLKEPIWDVQDLGGSASCEDKILSWKSIDWDIYGTNSNNQNLNHNGKPGSRGLMRTDLIYLEYDSHKRHPELWAGGAPVYDDDYLYCYDCYDPMSISGGCTKLDETICFPEGYERSLCEADNSCPVYETCDDNLDKDPGCNDGHYLFGKLRDYIAGTGCDNEGKATGIDGWYHQFHKPRERNINTPALFDELLVFPTYQPFNDKCKAEGTSYLYILDYIAGIGTGPMWVDPESTITEGTGQAGRDLGDSDSPFAGTDKVRTNASPLFGLTSSPSVLSSGDILTQDSAGGLHITESGKEKRSSNRLNWSDRCGSVEE